MLRSISNTFFLSVGQIVPILGWGVEGGRKEQKIKDDPWNRTRVFKLKIVLTVSKLALYLGSEWYIHT